MDRECSDSKITLLKVVLCTGDLFIWEVIKGQQGQFSVRQLRKTVVMQTIQQQRSVTCSAIKGKLKIH